VFLTCLGLFSGLIQFDSYLYCPGPGLLEYLSSKVMAELQRLALGTEKAETIE